MEKVSGIFCNEYARSVVIIGVDNSSSFHTDYGKNYFWVLGEGDTFGIDKSLGPPGKKLVLILVKQKQDFAWVCVTTLIIVFVC